MSDISNFFLILKKYYKFIIYSSIILFLASIFFSQKYIIDEKKYINTNINLSKILFDTQKEFFIVNNSIKKEDEFSVNNLSNKEIIDSIANGIKKDLKSNNIHITNFSLGREIEKNYENNLSFLLIDQNLLRFQTLIQNDFDDDFIDNYNKQFQAIVINNLYKVYDQMKNNINMQSKLFKESYKIRMKNELEEIDLKLNFFKKLYLDNIEFHIAMNQNKQLEKIENQMLIYNIENKTSEIINNLPDWSSNFSMHGNNIVIPFIENKTNDIEQNSLTNLLIEFKSMLVKSKLDWSPVIIFYSQDNFNKLSFIENNYSKIISQLEFDKKTINNNTGEEKSYIFTYLNNFLDKYFDNKLIDQKFSSKTTLSKVDVNYSRSILSFIGINIIGIFCIIFIIIVLDNFRKTSKS